MYEPPFVDPTPKVKPCICGKDKRTQLFELPKLSPNIYGIYVGSIVLAAIEVILFLMAAGGGTWLQITVALLYPAWIIFRALHRYRKGHTFACALRWSYLISASRWRFIPI